VPDNTNRVWAEDMSAAYDDYLVPAVFGPYAQDLARRIAHVQPDTILELAAGTGVLTRAILSLRPDVDITATDLNVAMVDVGSVRVPEALWRQVDAMQLPFDDASTDLVACQYGVMFFPDRVTAYTEVARVLRGGGHFLFNCWAPLPTHDVETAVTDALAEVFPDDPPRFLAEVPHGYHDEQLIASDLAAAGFSGVRIETVALDCVSPSARDLARGYCNGTPLRAQIDARGDRAAALEAVAAALERTFGPGPVVGAMSALVVDAGPVRPAT